MSFITQVQEKYGRPVTLQRFLASNPELRIVLSEPAKFIGTQSVVRWNDWGDLNAELGVWDAHKERALSSFFRPDLRMGRRELKLGWRCEIQDVLGISASKSDLTEFFSLDEMARTNSPEMLSEFTSEKLKEHLSHNEIRILHRAETTDHFARYDWDGRLFLVNEGGSHHFAAARLIARRIGFAVPLTATFVSYWLDRSAVAALQRDFDVYAIPGTASLLHQIHTALRAYQASYSWLTLPAPYEGIAIFLPRNHAKSVRASAELRNASLFNLGSHLTMLARRRSG